MLKLSKKGFTLIELLAVIVILAIIAVISTPIIMGIIDKSKQKALEEEVRNIEKAAEYYLIDDFRVEQLEEGKETIISIDEIRPYLSKYKEEMNNHYVIVTKTGSNVSFYYTGRDGNADVEKITLKSAVESDTTHIVNNTKVNGIQVNKVIGTKGEKNTIKNWVWYSGQLWQVLETSGSYIKLITANSVTSIAYGENSTWNTSWVRKWLNEIDGNSTQDGIYYNNLSRKDILMDGEFCLDEPNVTTEEFTISGETRQKIKTFNPINTCSSITTDKIGLMTFEDYVYSLNGTNGITGALGNSYIDDDELEWTMTKSTIGSATNKVWHTYYLNPSHIEKDWNTTKDYGKGVRPVIYLQSGIMIEKNEASNYGTLNNPYRLVIEIPTKSITYLSGAPIGSYIYLNESNATTTNTTEVINSRLSYTYDKTKVRYRVIGINSDGTVKIQRADVLRGLASTISPNSNTSVPYYYKQGLCDTTAGVYTDCTNNNYYKPEQGSGTYAYTESENVGYFLNNATNSYYNWLDTKVKAKIIDTSWNLGVSAHGLDYATSLFNTTTGGTYPGRTNDGIVTAKIGLPQWGDMFSGNDLNISYWYINRHPGSSSNVSNVRNHGYATTPMRLIPRLLCAQL